MTMDCLVQQPIWTGAYHNGGLPFHHIHHHFAPYYLPRKRNLPCSFYSGSCGLSNSLDDEVGFPADIKLESTNDCMPEDDKDFKVCVVCGEKASGFYFGALVCLPCKSFYIRCTKDGEPNFTCQCNGNCDIAKQGRIRCQYCRYQRCLMAGMCRKEKPETVQPAEGQVLCKVCGDIANGIHFGVNTCEGCKKFFRRGLVENQGYNCKAEKTCQINPRNRNNCRFCRYQKCLKAGMSREAIKMGRPKKSEGDSPQQSPSHSPSFNESGSPELSPYGSPQSNHSSPQMSPVQEPMFQMYMKANQAVKAETTCPPPSCQVQSELTSTRPVLATTPFMSMKSEAPTDPYNWPTSTSTAWPISQTITSHCDTEPAIRSQNGDNPMMIEDDMDDILNFIQLDQASRQQNRPSNFRDNSCVYQSQSMANTQCNNALMVNTCDNLPQTDSYHQHSPSAYQNSPSSSFQNGPCSPYQNSGPNSPYQQNSGPNSPYQQYQQGSQGSYYPGSQSPQYYPNSSSPQSNCHSPQSYNPSSPNYQPDYPLTNGFNTHQSSPGYSQQESIFLNCQSQHHINQMFINCSGVVDSEPSNNMINGDQITRDFVSCMLSSSTPNSCSYNNGTIFNKDQDSSSFPMSQKRKSCDGYGDSYGFSDRYHLKSQAGDFRCELYSLQNTLSYWKQLYPFDPSVRLTEENKGIINHLVSIFSELRVACDESMKTEDMVVDMNKDEHWPQRGQENNHWKHVQERIIRNNKALVEFCMKIPGFDHLNFSDKQELCIIGCFQAAIVLASSVWYMRDQKKFKNFWNWTISPDNPLYLIKLHLLQAGEVINKLELSPVELALTLALCFTSADLMNLKDSGSIEAIRRNLIFLLQHHLAEQGVNPNERIAAIFNIMPMTRHLSMWHKQLMKNMKANIEVGAVSRQVQNISI